MERTFQFGYDVGDGSGKIRLVSQDRDRAAQQIIRYTLRQCLNEEMGKNGGDVRVILPESRADIAERVYKALTSTLESWRVSICVGDQQVYSHELLQQGHDIYGAQDGNLGEICDAAAGSGSHLLNHRDHPMEHSPLAST